MSSPVVARAPARARMRGEPSRAFAPGYADRKRRMYRRRRMLAGALLVGLIATGAAILWVASRSGAPDVEVVGLVKGDLVGSDAAADLVIRVPRSALKIVLDGSDRRSSARLAGGRLEVHAGTVAAGHHQVEVTAPRSFLPDGHRTVRFTVDLTPPSLDVTKVKPVALHGTARIAGHAAKGTTVTVNNKQVPLHSGAFSLDIPSPVPPSAVVVATGKAGNHTQVTVPIPTVQPPVRGLHLTSIAWATPSLKNAAMGLVEAKKIDTIELDIKDESGDVGYESQVPLARQVGAVQNRFSLTAAVKEIHDHGARVIGRIVTYRDPRLANWAWESGKRSEVVQTPQGERYGAYAGGFLNPVDPSVRAYTDDLAIEALKGGIDEILLDYVRRPDGALSGMRFVGTDQEGDIEEKMIEDTVVDHLAELQTKVRATGGRLGASVFGIAATRPHEIAQDVPRLAQHLDYVAPMLYPSHWNKGEYGIAEPNKQPAEVIRRAMSGFGQAVEGTGASLVPWLQDFTLGVPYGEPEVRAQINAANDTGADGFLLWDANCTYTAAALDPK